MPFFRADRVWPEGGMAPALMLEYQKSHGRHAAPVPDAPVFLRHKEEQQPRTARQRVGCGRSA
jgi:hypothetical protein